MKISFGSRILPASGLVVLSGSLLAGPAVASPSSGRSEPAAAAVVPTEEKAGQLPESFKETVIKTVGAALVVMFFPPGYPTSSPHVAPPPPPGGGGDPGPPPRNPGDPGGGGGNDGGGGGGGGDGPPADNPEPATLISGLLGSSLLGLFAWWRRQAVVGRKQ
jgi:hypothetical protein